MSILQERLRAANKTEQKVDVEIQTEIPVKDISESVDEPQFMLPKQSMGLTPERAVTPLNIVRDKSKKPKKKEKTVQIELMDSAAMTEEILELEALAHARQEKKEEERQRKVSKIVNAILIIACLYIIFLIYGVIMTNYTYDENGRIVPQILSVSDIKDVKEFEIIQGQYENCRSLYEKVLMLDYRLGEGMEDPLTLAPEYEELLDDVENLSIKTDALDVDTKYEQVKNMLLVWIRDDIAVYLQKMSSAISQNNAEDANIAIDYRTKAYNDFSLITNNVVVMGDSINGTDMAELKKWSPEYYIDQTINKNE